MYDCISELYFEIRNLIDKFTEKLKTHNLCLVNISATGTCENNLCAVQYRQTDRREQYVKLNTDRPQTAMCTVHYRQTDRPQTAMCTIQNSQTADQICTVHY